MGPKGGQKGRGHRTNRPNRLLLERSPYLLQHAYNPVDWYPWCDEAFEAARRTDRPVFLSIGYATCNWCHIMAHESFEDPEIADLLNEHFVCIKVDREERPDIDAVYMQVCQMMIGTGGWPLTIVTTPDKRPFFAATYLPKDRRFGLIGLRDVLTTLASAWHERRDELLAMADQVVDALDEAAARLSSGEEVTPDVLHLAYRQISDNYDENFGGFSAAPKFPSPHAIMFLLRRWRRTGDERALRMAEHTLRAMRMGGLFDHVGFGFHRYSTDEQWLVPHFEKMLHDQALLSMAYTEAYLATGREEHSRTVREVFEYVLRDMTSPEGAFYSAEDADSEGEEGRFYLWTRKEVLDTLPEKEAYVALRVLNIKELGNFPDEVTHLPDGRNIPHMNWPLEGHAGDLDMSVEEFLELYGKARKALFEAREGRPRPARDDKVLADWNGLMIAALAMGGRALGEPAFIGAAARAADFILTKMRRPAGRLLHRYREGEAAIPGGLDDHAFVVWGLLELYRSTFDVRWLREAVGLNSYMIAHFWDDEAGGFFTTADDSEVVLVRQKEVYDGAVPSGNSVAVMNLLRLARLTANPDLDVKAAATAAAFSASVSRAPGAHAHLMSALEMAFGPLREVVLAGDPKDPVIREMRRELDRRFLPEVVVLMRPPEGEVAEALDAITGFTAECVPVDGRATAYVCERGVCRAPVHSADDLLKALGEGADSPG